MPLLQLLELAWALGPVVVALLRTLLSNLRKGRLVSDLPDASAAAILSARTVEVTAPIATAALEPVPPINPSTVVGSVIQTVTAHPDVEQSRAPSIIASILAGLYQAEPAIFAVSRASAKTQAEVGLGVGLAQIILGAFLRPNG